MIVRELIALLGFKIEDKGEAEAFERRLEKVQATALGVVGALAAVGAVAAAAVREFASSSADATDAAERIGTTTEALQELDYAATLGGASVDEIRQGLTALGAAAAGVTERGKATSEMLHGIGVATRDARGQARPTEDIFMDLAAALERIEDPGKRAAIAMRVFGGEGRGLVLMLNQGPAAIQRMREEARELGVVIGGDVVAAGNALDDQFQSLTFVARTLFRQLGAGAAKEIAPLVTGTLQWVQANRQLIQLRVAEAGKVIGSMLRGLGTTLELVGRWTNNMVTSFGGLKAALLAFAAVVTLVTAVVAPQLLITFGWAAALAVLGVAIGLIIEDIALFSAKGEEADTVTRDLKRMFFDEPFNANDSTFVTFLKVVIKTLGRVGELAAWAGTSVARLMAALSGDELAAQMERMEAITELRKENPAITDEEIAKRLILPVEVVRAGGLNVPNAASPVRPALSSQSRSTMTDNRTINVNVTGAMSRPEDVASAVSRSLQSLEPSYTEVE